MEENHFTNFDGFCPTTTQISHKYTYIASLRSPHPTPPDHQSACAIQQHPEAVIQSEVSQKEKNKYGILTHICGIYKNAAADPTCRAGAETQMQRTDMAWRGQAGWVG